MTETVSWPAGATRYAALRLEPGTDLREEIEVFFAAQAEQAGYLAASVGSLMRVALRFAGADEVSVTDGCYEFVSLSGTLSVDGPHLHLCVADEDGRVTGGHLLAGCTVRTTAELVIALVSGVRFGRSHDPSTGCAELTFARGERGLA